MLNLQKLSQFEHLIQVCSWNLGTDGIFIQQTFNIKVLLLTATAHTRAAGHLIK